MNEDGEVCFNQCLRVAMHKVMEIEDVLMTNTIIQMGEMKKKPVFCLKMITVVPR